MAALTFTDKMLIYMTILTVVIGVLIAARFVAASKQRFRTRARLFQDIFIILGYLGAVGIWISTVWGVALEQRILHRLSSASSKAEYYAYAKTLVPGLGMPHDDAIRYEQWSLADDYLAIWVLWCVKAAFLTIQYDMVRVFGEWHRRAVYAASVWMALSFLASVVTLAAYCHGHQSDAWYVGLFYWA